MKRSMQLCAACLILLGQGALAGEDSTHRWHGVGPAWYEVDGGLRRFAAGEEYDPVLGRNIEKKPPEKTAERKPPLR